jgi:outer membrane murein-binding lipoprotein Lpp
MSTPKYPVLAVFVIGFVVIAGSHLFEQLFPSEVSANKADSGTTAVSELSRKIDQQKQNVEAIVTLEAEEPTVMPEVDVPIAQIHLAVEELNDAEPPVVVQDVTQVSVKDSTNDSVVSQQIDLRKQVAEKIAELESKERTYITEGDAPLEQLQPAVNELKDAYPPVVVQDITEDSAEDTTNGSVVSQQIDLPKQVVEKIAALESDVRK